jgi:riboflavin kinase/FMN adenylyltransferase
VRAVDLVHEGDAIGLPGGAVVTVGTFDGIHVGQRTVLAEVAARAHRLGACAVAVMLDRDPAGVVGPDTAPPRLTDLPQRLELMAGTGIDVCYVTRFDEERSLQSPEEFVRALLVGTLRARAVVVGEDFDFGHRRRGDPAALADMQVAYGFSIVAEPLLGLPGHAGPVSSSAVRQALAEGDVTLAAAMLGRDHEVRGVVEHGDHRGRTIGVPTANVAVPGDIMLPTDGVYAGWYERAGGGVHPAAINLGRRPTFYDDPGLRLLEAHLLDFDGDLYREGAKVRFHARLRGEVKFAGMDALVEQLHADIAGARQALSAR